MFLLFILFLILSCFLLVNHSVYADGEIFKIETRGKQYCGEFIVNKFNAKNNIDQWVRIVNTLEAELSFTPDFLPESTFLFKGRSYLLNSRKARFVGLISLEDGSFVAMQSYIFYDKENMVRKIKGKFIQDNFTFLECFSIGKFKSTERLN